MGCGLEQQLRELLRAVLEGREGAVQPCRRDREQLPAQEKDSRRIGRHPKTEQVSGEARRERAWEARRASRGAGGTPFLRRDTRGGCVASFQLHLPGLTVPPLILPPTPLSPDLGSLPQLCRPSQAILPLLSGMLALVLGS